MGSIASKALRSVVADAAKEAKVLLVGMDSAGKTSLLYRMKLGESFDEKKAGEIEPTVGYNVETLKLKNEKAPSYQLTVYDIGSRDPSKVLRDHWQLNEEFPLPVHGPYLLQDLFLSQEDKHNIGNMFTEESQSNVNPIAYDDAMFMYEGGRSAFRPYLRKQLEEDRVKGVIYVLDSTDRANIGAAAEELQNLLRGYELSRCPCLILANKADLPSAMTLKEIRDELTLAGLNLNELKQNTKIFQTSAIQGTSTGLTDGVKWLTHAIVNGLVAQVIEGVEDATAQQLVGAHLKESSGNAGTGALALVKRYWNFGATKPTSKQNPILGPVLQVSH